MRLYERMGGLFLFVFSLTLGSLLVHPVAKTEQVHPPLTRKEEGLYSLKCVGARGGRGGRKGLVPPQLAQAQRF